MSCTGCNKKQVFDPDKSGLQYSYVDGAPAFLTGRDGQIYLLDRCVVSSLKSPVGGWGVSLWIKGNLTFIPGTGPTNVFQGAVETLKLNGISFTFRDLWLNLNLLWLERVSPKYQKVSFDSLLELTKNNF